MEIIVLSLSYSIDKLLDGIIGDKIREITSKYFDPQFVMERRVKGIKEYTGKRKPVVYRPTFSNFSSKVQAYDDRNKRMVEYASECYCFLDVGDKGLYPLNVAYFFNMAHPHYKVEIWVYGGGSLKQMSLDAAREFFKWKKDRYAYK